MFIPLNKSDLLDAKEIFRIIQIGLIYFEEQYGIKYPFTKLDLLFIPNLVKDAIHAEGAIALS